MAETRRRWRRCRSVTATILAVATISVACANRDDRAAERPTVLTTFTVLADIARNVAGDHLTVESITKPGAEIHEYEPTPGDIRRAAKANLIIDNGLGLETWFAKFVDGIDVRHVVASDGVAPLDIAEDAYAGRPNPHAWMSPLNVRVYADNIARAFGELDPAHAADYRANSAAYRARLQRVHDDLVRQLDALPVAQRALVTCEGAFTYLDRDAGLTEKYLWPVNADQQATPQRIASAIDFVRSNHVPAVFCESTVSDDPMQRVAEATGARFGGVLYVDSLSAADGPVPTYLDLIRYDATTIAKALTDPRPS